MGYRLNRLDEPVFMAVSKPMQTEFGIHHRLESCALICLKGKFKSPYKRGPIRSTRYKMERPRRGCVNLPYLAGTKKRPVKKGPYELISPSK